MTPAARIAAVIEILSEAPADMPAGAALRRGLQGRRYAGSGDRQAISALFWTVQRAIARLTWHLQRVDTAASARTLVLAALHLVDGQSGEDIRTLFGAGDKHGPPPLTEDEASLLDALDEAEIDDATMPRAVRLEWPEALVDDASAALGDQLETELVAMRGEAGADIRINPLKIEAKQEGINCFVKPKPKRGGLK